MIRAKTTCEGSAGADLNREEPHVVANLLLLYFREMPQPLLEFKLYDKWVQALGACSFVCSYFLHSLYLADSDRKVMLPAFKKLLKQLPKKQVVLLSYLMQFLHTLLKYSAHNGSTVATIGKAFGIFLLRPQGFRPDGGKKAALLVETLLMNYDELLV